MKTNEERLKFMRKVNKEYEPAKVQFFGTEYVGEIRLENGTKIGHDSSGWEWDGKMHVKFYHRGDVKIGENVDIGANSTIPRATIEGEATEIGYGTKIDDQVHIAHNCKIGKHNIICAGAIFCGGVVTGDRVFIGAGATIREHINIGDDATIGMGSVVVHDVPAGAKVFGNPAKIMK